MPTSRAALATIGHRRARIPRRVAPRQSPPPFPDNALEGLRSMAGRNVTAALDAHNAKLDAMRSELTVQRWLMGLGFAALVAAAIAQLFRG